jgi:hypothetical protein
VSNLIEPTSAAEAVITDDPESAGGVLVAATQVADPPADVVADIPVDVVAAAAVPTLPDRQFKRGLSTGFSQRIKGKNCAVCGFQGFPWQSVCPQGHPLA